MTSNEPGLPLPDDVVAAHQAARYEQDLASRSVSADIPPGHFESVFDKYSTPGLRRGEMSSTFKRQQLWQMGVRGVEADQIIEALYAVKA